MRYPMDEVREGLEAERLARWSAERDRRQAQWEVDNANAEASFLRSRPRVVLGGQDVTEMVVSILDALMGSLDAGSGFLDDDTEKAMEELGILLKFDERPVVKRPGLSYKPPESFR